jgi:hypothetical protein
MPWPLLPNFTYLNITDSHIPDWLGSEGLHSKQTIWAKGCSPTLAEEYRLPPLRRQAGRRCFIKRGFIHDPA